MRCRAIRFALGIRKFVAILASTLPNACLRSFFFSKTREEERSEASIGARTGASDLVPMLNLMDEDIVTATIALDSEDEATPEDEGKKIQQGVCTEGGNEASGQTHEKGCLLYTSPSPRD